MKDIRTAAGTAICIVSFVGLLYCALQHANICSSMPTLNAETNNVVAYYCKGHGVDAFVTPSQYALKNRVAPLLCLTLLIGAGLRRWRSPD